MVIAFCTCCMNRRWQMEQTLPHNLQMLRSTPHFLALCDYNSSDGLEDLVRRFDDDLLSGTLVYFRTTEPTTFHASLAKNTAHRLALRSRPDVVFNLDADNFITRETIELVTSTFSANIDSSLHNWSEVWGDGSAGRIAMSSANWARIGGYDETFLGMVGQDIDLLIRARAAGLSYLASSAGLRPAVKNTDQQKFAYVEAQQPTSDHTAREMLNRYHLHNLIHSLKRPIRWELTTQHRYHGHVNHNEEATI